MTYCTLSEAKQLFPTLTISASGTVITTPQAEAVIDAIGREIDMHLRARGYALPVTDADALASLKTVCMYGSAAAVYKVVFPASDGIGGDGGAATFWEAKYQEHLRLIDAGALVDASGGSGSGGSFAHGFGDGTEAAEAPY